MSCNTCPKGTCKAYVTDVYIAQSECIRPTSSGSSVTGSLATPMTVATFGCLTCILCETSIMSCSTEHTHHVLISFCNATKHRQLVATSRHMQTEPCSCTLDNKHHAVDAGLSSWTYASMRCAYSCDLKLPTVLSAQGAHTAAAAASTAKDKLLDSLATNQVMMNRVGTEHAGWQWCSELVLPVPCAAPDLYWQQCI